jgi:AraC family transcriptional regulator, transcriptional activator of pobA
MQETKGLLEQIKLHDKLAIRVSSNSNNDLPAEVMKMLTQPHRKANYFFVFIESRLKRFDDYKWAIIFCFA